MERLKAVRGERCTISEKKLDVRTCMVYKHLTQQEQQQQQVWWCDSAAAQKHSFGHVQTTLYTNVHRTHTYWMDFDGARKNMDVSQLELCSETHYIKRTNAKQMPSVLRTIESNSCGIFFTLGLILCVKLRSLLKILSLILINSSVSHFGYQTFDFPK